jgi:hypothetical protein
MDDKIVKIGSVEIRDNDGNLMYYADTDSGESRPCIQPMETCPDHPDHYFMAFRLHTRDWCEVHRDDFGRHFVRNHAYAETEHFQQYAGWAPLPKGFES